MFKASLRTLFAHRMRLAMTMMAIVLGVAFVTGTMVFTSGMSTALDRFFDNEPADVVVTPAAEVQSGLPGQNGNPTMSESVADEVAAIDGVARVTPVVQQNGTLILGEDDQVVGGGSQLQLGNSWNQTQAQDDPDSVEGRAPTRYGEVALDTSTAAKAGVAVGDSIRIATPIDPDPTQRWEVTAIVDLGLPGGATVAIFDFETAQQHLVGPGLITQVNADIDEGLTQPEMVQRLADSLGEEFQVLTGADSVAATQDAITGRLDFLNTFLLVFALIAVFVAGFLIFNTFAMLVAQRTKELALLRAIGASRDQVRLSVLLESLLMGVVSAVIGLFAGLLLARLLRVFFDAFGFDLPFGDMTLTPQIIGAGFAVGIVITLVAAIAPAIRASKVPPVAAMRDDIIPPAKAAKERLAWGIVLALSAVAFAVLGLTSENPNYGVAWTGLSAMLGITAVVVLSAWLARPFVRLVGILLRGSTMGRLATLNAERNPRRTAATASALTIGVTLMTIMAIFTTSATASANASIDRAIGADFVITDASFRPFSPDVLDAVSALPSTQAATSVRTAPAQKSAATTFVFAVDPVVLPQMLTLEFTGGSLDSLTEGNVGIDSLLAEEFGLEVGDTTTATFPSGDRDVVVGGIYVSAALLNGFLTNAADAELYGLPEGLGGIYVNSVPGADRDVARTELEEALADYPTLQVQDNSQLKQDFEAQINRLLGFVFALLGLAVLIAMLGIVNTMQMSVVERTRELGMLRAVGSQRKQVRTMIVLEALMLGSFGALLGVCLGIIYGVIMRYVMEPFGLEVVAIPWPLLVLFVVAGALGGVVAAWWPAVRASRLNVLQAIATQ